MSKTDIQEDGSKWIFQRALRDNVDYTNLQPSNQFISKKEQERIIALYEDSGKRKKKWDDSLNILFDKKYEELQKIFNPSYNPKKDTDPISKDWLIAYYGQQKALLDKYSAPKFKEARFDRGEGFMPFITNIAKKLGVNKKDTWNPADVWIVDTKKEPNLEKKLIETVQIKGKFPTNQKERDRKIQELNTILRNYYRAQILIGVSLKKSGKNAIYIPVNVKESEEKTLSEFDAIEGIVCEIDKIICQLNLKPATSSEIDKYKEVMEKVGISSKKYPEKPLSFNAKHAEIYISDNVHKTTYKLDLISVDVRKLTNLKYEPVDLSKKTAKLGQAGVDEVQTLFDKYKIGFVNDHNLYPRSMTDSNSIKTVETLLQKFNMAKNKSGVKFISNVSSMKQFQENLEKVYLADIGAAVSKLMQLDLISDILNLNKKDLNEMLTDIIYMAQKKGRKYGPFGKVY